MDMVAYWPCEHLILQRIGAKAVACVLGNCTSKAGSSTRSLKPSVSPRVPSANGWLAGVKVAWKRCAPAARHLRPPALPLSTWPLCLPSWRAEHLPSASSVTCGPALALPRSSNASSGSRTIVTISVAYFGRWGGPSRRRSNGRPSATKRRLPRGVSRRGRRSKKAEQEGRTLIWIDERSEEHTSELQSRQYLVCRPPLEKNI